MSLFKPKNIRTSEMQLYAGKHNFEFAKEGDSGLIKYFGDFKLFRPGSRKAVFHQMHTADAMLNERGMFDYRYIISTGKSTHVFWQTVYYRIDKSLMMPEFHLYPEKWYHTVGKWFGKQDIDFAQYPDFSKNYILQGPQQDFIETIFDEPDLIAHFNRYKTWSVEAVGYYFVMYKYRKFANKSYLTKLKNGGDRLYDILKARTEGLTMGI